jgi:hypothetical protein
VLLLQPQSNLFTTVPTISNASDKMPSAVKQFIPEGNRHFFITFETVALMFGGLAQEQLFIMLTQQYF